MMVQRAGLSVVSYVYGSRATSHLLRVGGRTVCGVSAFGSRWQAGHKFDPAKDCKRCARVARHGIAQLLRFCPKCASDLGLTFILLHNHECPICGNRWI
jgi:hypothetical protein